MGTTPSSSNFILALIERDNATAKYEGRVVTRFPPEPNGYLHIGHAKSICLNFGLASHFQGRCHLRFDDTNPEKEDQEYVDAIQRDIRWLGFEWGDNLFHASDYFDRMYALAVQMIRDGLAYVCDLSLGDIRKYRGTVTEAGRPSPFRVRSVEENLDLFARMKSGEFPEGSRVLRARIDMASANMKMRDPLMYRIKHVAHQRTGEAWSIYPMYDYAHCLSDSFERITHSICTLEFENNRQLYDWFLAATKEPQPRPEQTEFARLNLTYTMMSKRKLLRLVQEGLVSGWDDPRMPSIAGFRRRGYTPASIRRFAHLVGVAKANSTVDVALLEHAIRDDLNDKAPRMMAVLDPVKVIVDNHPGGDAEWLDAPFFPHDIGKEGSRKLPFTRELYIERADFMETPSKKFFRMAPGREVRLRYGYLITCTGIEKDPSTGEIVAIHADYDPASRGGDAPDGRRIKATLHWVSATEGVRTAVRLYDRLFKDPAPDAASEDLTEILNPDSLITISAVVEPALVQVAPGAHVQFERQGYFVADIEDSSAGAPVFNRTVPLKDTWAKVKAGAAATSLGAQRPAADRPEKESQEGSPKPRDLSEEDQATVSRLHQAYNLGDEQCLTLASNPEALAFFESAATSDNAASLANWTINGVMPVAEISELPFDSAALARLALLVDEGTVSSTAGKSVLEVMLGSGGAPDAIIEQLGLTQVSDRDTLLPMIEAALANNPDHLKRYHDGNTRLMGFFVGQVMKASKGSADPKLVNALLAEALGAQE